MLKSFAGRTIIIGVILVAGITVGMIDYYPTPAKTDTTPNQSQIPAYAYPVNENGQTYGSASYATSLETEPDLILATGVGSTIGYVQSEDLNGVQPKTPEEALELMRKAPSARKIPLYAVDGKTVIGTFEIDKGTVVEYRDYAQ